MSNWTPEQMSARRTHVWKKTDGHCFYCDRKLETIEMQIDHYLPKAAGGPDILANLVPACGSCNSTKGRYHPDAFKLRLYWRSLGIPEFTGAQRDWLREQGFTFPELQHPFDQEWPGVMVHECYPDMDIENATGISTQVQQLVGEQV